MWIKRLGFSGLYVVVVALGAGCKKSQAASPSQPPGWDSQPVISLHWDGTKQLSKDPSAGGFLNIWKLAETERLKNQTLDKLALAPWRASGTNAHAALTNFSAAVRQNASASALRPLLDDLVQEECYLEIREDASKKPQIAIAVRLDNARSAAWDNNLGTIIETATGAHRVAAKSPSAQGWHLSGNSPAVSNWLRTVDFSRIGDWTVVGMSVEQNAAYSNLLGRATNKQLVSTGTGSNSWLSVQMDLLRASRAFSWGWDLPQAWPRVSLLFNGDGQNVLTRGTLDFPSPLPFQVEPWNIPTNLVHEPLHSFTAVQGVQQWLSSWGWWQNLHVGTAPNQVFFWGQSGSPFLDYAAAFSPDSARIQPKLARGVMDSMNPILATNRMGKWERSTNSDGVEWHAPVISPFIQSTTTQERHYILAGLSPFGLTNGPTPVGTFKELLGQPNLVYYSREITGPRIEAWLYISQIFRVIFRRAQLPPQSQSIAWLKAAAPFLGNCTTLMTKNSATSLALSRTSSVGLTGMEIHALADWLESQEFPGKPYSLVAKLRPPPVTAVNGGAGK